MTLIEKLIAEPSDSTTELLFDDHTEVFWVDWREDDAALAEYCESIIKSRKLSSFWNDEKLVVQYGDATTEVPLTKTAADRHITLVTINNVLAPHYEVRMVWDSDGSDTVAFAILSQEKWAALERQYGIQLVDRAFLRLSMTLNTFTDSLHGVRPGSRNNRKWWQFWR